MQWSYSSHHSLMLYQQEPNRKWNLPIQVWYHLPKKTINFNLMFHLMIIFNYLFLWIHTLFSFHFMLLWLGLWLWLWLWLWCCHRTVFSWPIWITCNISLHLDLTLSCSLLTCRSPFFRETTLLYKNQKFIDYFEISLDFNVCLFECSVWSCDLHGNFC